MKAKLFVVLATATVLAGCVDKTQYESAPMRISTAKGDVTCQLYTKTRVLWDTAIAKPAGMSDEEANAVCINEGNRILGKS